MQLEIIPVIMWHCYPYVILVFHSYLSILQQETLWDGLHFHISNMVNPLPGDSLSTLQYFFVLDMYLDLEESVAGFKIGVNAVEERRVV